MVVKATVAHLRITEIPTTLSPDGRNRPPHLKSWRDGWRHLRFLLLFSPRGLFLYPGCVLFFGGILLVFRLAVGPIRLGAVTLDIHTMLYAGAAAVVGWQSIIFWVCAKVHGMREGIVPEDQAFRSALRSFSLERALLLSFVLLVLGLALGAYVLGQWGRRDFGSLQPTETMRLVIPSVTAVLLAAETAYGAAFLAVLHIRRSGGAAAR